MKVTLPGEADERRIAAVVTRDYIVVMKAVGVRELKAHLSRYLRDVAGGEVVLVTDRGTVVAELRAPEEKSFVNESDLDRRLREMARRYPMTIGRKKPGYVYPESPVKAPPGTWKILLDAEREERA